MAELINLIAQAPDGVKAFLIGCAIIFVIGVICIIAEAVEESRHEKTRWRRGHG